MINSITVYDLAYLEIDLMAHQALRKIEDRWNKDTAESCGKRFKSVLLAK